MKRTRKLSVKTKKIKKTQILSKTEKIEKRKKTTLTLRGGNVAVAVHKREKKEREEKQRRNLNDADLRRSASGSGGRHRGRGRTQKREETERRKIRKIDTDLRGSASGSGSELWPWARAWAYDAFKQPSSSNSAGQLKMHARTFHSSILVNCRWRDTTRTPNTKHQATKHQAQARAQAYTGTFQPKPAEDTVKKARFSPNANHSKRMRLSQSTSKAHAW